MSAGDGGGDPPEDGDGGDGEKPDWKTKPYRELNPEELEKRRALRKREKERERQRYLDSRPDNPYENSPAEKADVVPPMDGKQPETVNWIAEARDEGDGGGDGGSGDGGAGSGGAETDLAAGDGADSEYAFAEGDVVEYDGEKAVVTTVMTEPFDAPTQRALASESSESGIGSEESEGKRKGEGEDGVETRSESESANNGGGNGDGDDPPEETIEASEDEPLFIVLPESEGWEAVSADELTPSAFGDGEPDVRELGKADLVPTYTRAGKKGIAVTDLVNSRDAKDPRIGFDELPEDWDRKSVLQAYASLGASFSTCRTQMAGEILFPARFCTALKDEVFQSTQWRSWE